MTSVPELTDLFVRLATHLNDTSLPHPSPLQHPNQAALDLSISNLNHSLNAGGDSRVRVLDTVLSLMCFKAPQVFDSVIEYSVKTIVAVLLSSIRCGVVRRPKDEILMVGSSISGRDFGDLIESCGAIVEKLEGHGKLSETLLCAFMRVASSASMYRQLESLPVREERSVDARSSLVSKLMCRVPSATLLVDTEMPLRLLVWYLDPLVLKGDVSNILQVAMRRPFLCLSNEFHESTEWRSVIVSLVLSPIMFVEARALLHRWFLLTGLASVLELLIQLVTVALDVISRPTFWGILADLGGNLPFSNAYFPYNHQLLRNLAGPLSYDGFLQLLHETSESVSPSKTQLSPSMKSPVLKVSTVDHKSKWSLAISFPDWFYFAAALLFSDKASHNSCHKLCLLAASKVGETHYEELPSTAAARYIAWILSPVSRSHEDRLADLLIKHSESRAWKQHGKDTSYKKKLKKLKLCEEDHTSTRVYDDQSIAVWLNGFSKICGMYCSETINNHASSERKPSSGLGLQNNVLFRRIPLGLLLCCSSHLSEEGTELLLHYSTTGRIFQSRETKTPGSKHVKCNSGRNKNPVSWSDECNQKEAIAGARLVFRLTDIAEGMCSSLFESDEASIDFICRVKMQVSKYLIKCIKRFIQLGVDEDVMVTDLCGRLEKWRHQGRVVFELQQDVDSVIQVLSQMLAFCDL